MTRERVKKWLWISFWAAIAFQIYFVRELFAAELLFGLLFVVLLLIGSVLYLIGQAGEVSLNWAKPFARLLAQTARRGLVQVEEFSRKSYRHLRSESAR
jgi:hypothetical protein